MCIYFTELQKNEATPTELNIEVDKFTLTVGNFIFFFQ